jgi:GT2 family glycosyltransferase
MYRKKIDWKVEFGAKKGQVLNHQRALVESSGDLIWRLDDDNIPECDCLENLARLLESNEAIGAVGGLVLDPKIPIRECKLASNKIEDIFLGLNQQWFRQYKIFEVDHLYSTFLYRKSAGEHGYNMNLSPVGHREETLFSYGMKQNGWLLYVHPDAITWHYRFPFGGIREGRKIQFEHDEKIFREVLRDIKFNDYWIAVLDNGIGDHIVFKKLLPDIRSKFAGKKIIIMACYQNVFEGCPETVVGLDEAKLIYGNLDIFNVYQFMIQHNWKGTLEQAYRKMYSLD